MLRWRLSRLNGDREVSILILEQDQLPGVYFLLFASAAGEEAFLNWLARHPQARVRNDRTVAETCTGHLDALLRHIVGSFAQLDLFGGTPT